MNWASICVPSTLASARGWTGWPRRPAGAGPTNCWPDSGADTMYCATFTFAKGEYDDEFHQRDQAITDIAKSVASFQADDGSGNTAAEVTSTASYWETLETLHEPTEHTAPPVVTQLQGESWQGHLVILWNAPRS